MGYGALARVPSVLAARVTRQASNQRTGRARILASVEGFTKYRVIHDKKAFLVIFGKKQAVKCVFRFFMLG